MFLNDHVSAGPGHGEMGVWQVKNSYHRLVCSNVSGTVCEDQGVALLGKCVTEGSGTVWGGPGGGLVG